MSLRNIKLVEGLPFEVPPIEDVTDILPRNGTWEDYPKKRIEKGVDTGEWMPKGLRNPDAIDTIIVHHTASDAPLKNQANYHVKTHKWPGIGYHIVIDSGKIKQTNDLLSMTFHAGGHNTYTVGICVNANLAAREITDQERKLLYAAILTVKSLLPIKHIKGHYEVNATTCPATSMDRIRDDIAKLEFQMKAGNSPEEIIRKCYVAANQHAYLYKQYSADPQANKWLEPMLLGLYEHMKEKGMFFGSE